MVALGADVFVDDADGAGLIDLNPQADERIDKTKIDRAIERQVRIVFDRPYVHGGIEIRKDGVFQ